MKNTFLRFCAIILAACMLFSLFACKPGGKKPSQTEPEVTTEAPDPSIAIKASYDKAIEKLSKEDALHLDVTVKTTRTVGCDDYLMSIERSCDYVGLLGEDMTALVTDKISLDSTVISRTETYSSGKLFSEYKNDDNVYLTEMSEEELFTRVIPYAALTSGLYETAAYEGDGKNTIVFTDATALESWLAPEYAELISAEGRAVLSDDGSVSLISYNVEYRQGPALFSSAYTVSTIKSELTAEKIAIPSVENCRLLDNIDTPFYLLMANDVFENTDTVITNITEDISVLVGASPVILSSYNDSLYLHKQDGNVYAKVDGSMSIEDIDGKVEDKWTRLFNDNKSTVSLDGKEPVTDNHTSADYVKEIRDLLNEYMPEITDLKKITSTENEEFLLVEFDYTESQALNWEDCAAGAVYSNPAFLDNLSSDYKTVTATGHVSFDKDTLLPTGIYISYAGSHNIEGDMVMITFEASLQVDPSNDQAYKEVTGKFPNAKEPEKKATPLFYEVTSPEGGKMYLFGTIHIGDVRTSYLPDEICSALESSDVLALEINTETYMDDVMASNIYTDLYREGTYYTDGTTIKDHLSEELYEKAVNFLKMSGQYVSFYEVVRPAPLSSTIEYFYCDSSKVLHSYRGVEENLMMMAKENGMEIRSIEKIEDRLNMAVRYSETVHRCLLEASLETTRHETVADAKELYELWCEGDEAKMKEYIREDEEFSEDTPEEEIKAYEEYNNMLMTERDQKMLTEAKKYLSNPDEVVFFAVGTAHLFSETGLIDALREAGYTVQLVEYK